MGVQSHTKDIVGYEGLYVICNDGRVWSYFSRRFLKPRVQGGYACVRLYKDDLKKEFPVHRLVAIHFIKNPKCKPFVHHKDCNKSNNDHSNLKWTTEQENTNYSWKDGRSKHTHSEYRRLRTSVVCRKLSEEQEDDIRSMYSVGNVKQSDLAEMYFVNRVTIMRIINYRHKVKRPERSGKIFVIDPKRRRMSRLRAS